MKDCPETYYDRKCESKPSKEALLLKNISKEVKNHPEIWYLVFFQIYFMDIFENSSFLDSGVFIKELDSD